MGGGEPVRTHFLNMAGGRASLLFPLFGSDEAAGAAARQGDLERGKGGEEMVQPMPRCTPGIGADRLRGLLPRCAGWASSSVGFLLCVRAGLYWTQMCCPLTARDP